ncbi:hypothetical protein BH09DEP1_BH09DEP1_7400 [soil metagenome]
MKQWTGTLLLLLCVFMHAQTQNQYTIKNSITKKMTGYEFLKITYHPEDFQISVNGKALEPGATLTVPTTEKKLTVRYDYSFYRGWRTGAKEVTLELSSDKQAYDLNFSWHDKWRIMAEGAQAKEVKKLKYKA